MNLYDLDAVKLSEKIKSGEINTEKVLDTLVERIEKEDEKIGSYASYDVLDAKKQIENLKDEMKTSKLFGVPVALKDNIVSYGQKTSAASKILENYIGTYDATVVKRMKEAGIIVFGKANMDEFAMGSSNENSSIKAVSNPFDLERIPGGSSGGSAAMVASKQAYIALGSDTGGSVRQPAAFTATVGLKPTYGRISRYGLMAFASSLDQIGIIARNTTDVAALLEIIAGYDENDATSSKEEVKEYTKYLNNDISNLKIGLASEYFAKGLDENVKESIFEAIEVLKKQGVQFEQIELPHTKYAVAAYYIIASAEASSNLARYDGVRYGLRASNESVEELYVKTRSEGFGMEVKRRIMIGNYVLCSGFYDAYFKKASQVRRLISQDFKNAFEKVDLIIGPTSPILPFKKGEKIKDPLAMYLSDIYTVPVSLAGLPALSVPTEFKNNLPVGMQIIGNYFKEDLILNLAHVYEKLRGEIKY